MNRIDRLFGLKGEARVRYGDGDFQVTSSGDFVRCAVTGVTIPLSELRYWNVARQEAYASADASLRRHLEIRQRRSPAR